MRSIWARTAVVAIATVILGGTQQLASAQRGDPAVDTRERVVLTEAQRNQILAEMRGMLESVRGILFGLANNNNAAVQKAAQASSVETTANAQLDQRAPQTIPPVQIADPRGVQVAGRRGAGRYEAGRSADEGGEHLELLRGLPQRLPRG